MRGLYTKCFIASDNCVTVWDIKEINRWIDEYNRTPFLVREGCFWEWLSWNLGENYYHFTGHVPCSVHKIRGMNNV